MNQFMIVRKKGKVGYTQRFFGSSSNSHKETIKLYLEKYILLTDDYSPEEFQEALIEFFFEDTAITIERY